MGEVPKLPADRALLETTARVGVPALVDAYLSFSGEALSDLLRLVLTGRAGRRTVTPSA